MNWKCALIAAASLMGTPLTALNGLAQNYPAKPVRIIVPFPAGGPIDIFARSLGDGFREQTGQPFVIDNKPSVQKVKSGQARAILIPGSTRNASLPDAQNFDDMGLPKFDTKLFYGVFVPAATPTALVQRLNSELVRTVRSEGFRGRFLKQGGYEPVGNSIEEFNAFLAQDRARGQELVTTSGVTLKQ